MDDDSPEPSPTDVDPVADPASEPAYEPSSDGVDGAYATSAEEPALEPPRSNRRRILATVTVVVVVLLVAVGLIFTGDLGTVLPSGRNSPSGVASVSFASAYDSINSSVQSTPGGPWALYTASALDVLSNGSWSTYLPTKPGGPCAEQTPPALVHAAPNDAARGLSPYWSFGFESTSANMLLDAVVVNGQGDVLGTVPLSASCGAPYRWGTLPPVRGIEDSTQFAPALPNLNLFLRSFPNSTMVFYLGDEFAALGKVSGVADWAVTGTPCFGSGNASVNVVAPGDPYYLGGANATSGQTAGDDEFAGIGSCEISGTLGSGLQVAAPQLVSAGSGYGYRSNVDAAGNGLTPEMFHPVVVESGSYDPAGGSAASAVTGFAVLGANGSAVAVYNVTVGTWTVGGSTPLTTSDTLELLTSRLIDGAVLVLVANAPETGDIGLNLP